MTVREKNRPAILHDRMFSFVRYVARFSREHYNNRALEFQTKRRIDFKRKKTK